MSKTKIWIGAMRLRTLPLSLSGIILGSAAAFHNSYWDTLVFMLAMGTTISFQVLSNFANDLGDSQKGTDNSYRIGPMRSVQSGEISKSTMKKAVILTSVISFILAGLLIYFASKNMSISTIWFYIVLSILSVFAAISYTVGKKAYGYHGLGDLMVLFFFGGVSVLGVYSLYAPEFLPENILLAVFVGLLSVAVLNLNNMRDYINDKASGKNTLVVKMGPNMAKIYHSFLILFGLGALIMYFLNTSNNDLFFSLFPALFLMLHLKKVLATKKAKEFDPELKKVALLTFSISVLIAIGLFVS
tara:strand:+ start:428 stop:1330 length:903 start_codon:yes stop_codon:yes gene_type:complete